MSRYAVLNDPDHQALQWYVEHGVDECLNDEVIDRTAQQVMDLAAQNNTSTTATVPHSINKTNSSAATQDVMGTSDAIIAAQKLVKPIKTLDELKQAIRSFDGLSIKKTTTNMVFADGQQHAPVMVIGEAPGADDDQQGKPFLGANGQLLDAIFASIKMNRDTENLESAIYLSNILNWRPPGNRTPTQSEIDISRPFIDKHISLAKPKIIVLCGAVAAQGLLQQKMGISKLRQKFHPYETEDGHKTLAMVTYHPAYLIRTPAQKRATWKDMLMLQEKVSTL